MCATAANLIERVLPETALRQWVLTFPFPWRRRLAHDGALLSALSRIFVESVHAFYVERAATGGARGAKTGAVTVVQRTSKNQADYLKSRRVAFVFKDIDETPGAAAEMREKLTSIGRGGERGIPVIDVRGKILVGFHRADVDRALAKTSGRR
jgi:hypothetical protein